MNRVTSTLAAVLIAAVVLLGFAPARSAPDPAPATYRISSLGPAISVVGVSAGGAVFATIPAGPGAQSAAYLSVAAPATLVATGYAWSEAAAIAGPWEFVNAQATAGKTFGLRRTGGSGAWSKCAPASGHTAAKVLRGALDGAAYGWSLGKVGGKATYCAVRWSPGSSAPQILATGNTEALGEVPGGTLVRARKTTASSGALKLLASDGTATTISTGDVVGAVAVGGQAVGAVLVGDDLRPALWSGGAQTILSTPPVGQSAVALTRAGAVVYGYRTAQGSQIAAMWDQAAGGALVDLPAPPGLALRTIAAVGPGGDLVGLANNSQGDLVAWIGVPG